jgi:exodeoxyribonuclease V alpha subunit
MNASIFQMFLSRKHCKLEYNDLVYYNKIIYEVKNVSSSKYTLSQYEVENSHLIEINQTDSSLQFIFKDVQEKIRKAHSYQNRYNKEIERIGFQLLTLEFLIEYTIKQRLFSIKSINELPFIIKNTRNPSLNLYNIIKNPMDFVLPDYILLSYDKAYEICQEFNIVVDFNIHIEKWSYYTMNKHGSFYIPFNHFIMQFKEFCSLHKKTYEEQIHVMNEHFIHKEIDGKNYRTIQYLIDMEDKITNQMIDCFYDEQYDISREDIEEHISAFERLEKGKEVRDFKFNNEQKESIYGSITNKLYIINGYPGTGKSTVVKCILYVFYQLNRSTHLLTSTKFPHPKNISILAPTGLAYVNLSKKCKNDKIMLFDEQYSGTCHRMLYNKFREDEMVDRNVIIVDEFSMIDIRILKDIANYCNRSQCRLIIIGDENQLPSIGPGCCLLNLIRSNIFEQTKLVEIKRQDEGILMENIKKMTCEILCKSHMIDDTMKLLPMCDFINTKDHMLDASRIGALLGENDLFDIEKTKVLTYFKDEKFKCNTKNLNNILQNLFNARGMQIKIPNKSFISTSFRVGDRIIRTENDYSDDNMRANGEFAIIKKFDYTKNKVLIVYDDDDEIDTISVHTLYDEFALGYALTVHKSQGSQYENVVIFIDENQHAWSKTALYTAISRAKKRCIIITNEKDFLSIQRKNHENKVSLFMRESSEYDI